MKPKDRYYESAAARANFHSGSCSSDDDSPMDLSVKKVPSGSAFNAHHLTSVTLESLRASRNINHHHNSHHHNSHHHNHQLHPSLNQNLLMNELAARYMILNSELRSTASPGLSHGGTHGGSLSSLLPYLLLRPFSGSTDTASSILSASSPSSDSPAGSLHATTRQGDTLLLAAAAAAAAAAATGDSSPSNGPSNRSGNHLIGNGARSHLHHQRASPSLSPGLHSSDIDLPLTVDSVTATADLLLDSSGLTNKPRITRPLTGRYVRHGTGASPSTLLSLRKMLEERKMRITPLPRKGYKKNVRRRK